MPNGRTGFWHVTSSVQKREGTRTWVQIANPGYIRKVERVGGKLQNTVIYTYPHVSQFWKYNPEEFLKQPVYSRDFPPCRHC